MSYTQELRTRICKMLPDLMPSSGVREILKSDLWCIGEDADFDSDTPISPEARQVFFKVAELAMMLSTMADRAELRELQGKIGSYNSRSSLDGRVPSNGRIRPASTV